MCMHLKRSMQPAVDGNRILQHSLATRGIVAQYGNCTVHINTNINRLEMVQIAAQFMCNDNRRIFNVTAMQQ